jgi:hypothetical protein
MRTWTSLLARTSRSLCHCVLKPGTRDNISPSWSNRILSSPYTFIISPSHHPAPGNPLRRISFCSQDNENSSTSTMIPFLLPLITRYNQLTCRGLLPDPQCIRPCITYTSISSQSSTSVRVARLSGYSCGLCVQGFRLSLTRSACMTLRW